MSKLVAIAVRRSAVGVICLLIGLPALAAGHGNGGSGGNSAAHISSQGIANSNGPNAVDRQRGIERAGQRANAQGVAHGKGLQASHHTAHGHSGN
jgi:hypothetical protein